MHSRQEQRFFSLVCMRPAILLLAAAAAAAWALSLPPIPEDPAYHHFADARRIWGIPHALNVLTSLALCLIGAYGLLALRRMGPDRAFATGAERLLYALFFTAIVLTGLASAYYHWAPDHGRLFWDRLAMSMAFMALLAAMFAERVHPQIGLASAPPLLLAGMAATAYWRHSELAGAGDLRFYGLVQFLPLLLIPLLVLLWPPRYTRSRGLLGVLACYVLAKACEFFDAEIYAATGWISGHSLKHLAAAAAVFLLARMLRLRQRMAA